MESGMGWLTSRTAPEQVLGSAGKSHGIPTAESQQEHMTAQKEGTWRLDQDPGPQKAHAENGAWQIYQSREMAPESEWPAQRPSEHLLTESLQV